MAVLKAWLVSKAPAHELERIEAQLRRRGYVVEGRDPSRFSAEAFDRDRLPDLLLTDGVLAGQSAQNWAHQIHRRIPHFEDRTAWAVLVSARPVELVGRLAQVGILSLVSMPLNDGQLSEELSAIDARRKDPFREIGDLVMLLTGVQLDASKSILIEKRLTKRMLELGIRNIADYVNYFRRHRDREIPMLVSQLTTHTTQFFRDTNHFDSLVDEHLPRLMQEGRPFRIWSAACSTGEEVYSIAIALLAGARAKGLREPQFEILGTDIDPLAVQEAQRGIYRADSVNRIHPEIVKTYFDRGSGEIGDLYRVKPWVWERCKFRIQNLLSETYPEGPFDAVFARNVFIYFKKQEVSRIAARMGGLLTAQGRIYIGFSETLDRGSTGLRPIGKAIYGHERPDLVKNPVPIVSAGPSVHEAARPVVQASTTTSARPFIKVMIVDDSRTIRHLLRSILTPDQGFVVVGEAANPVEAMEFLKDHSVDVMTLDIHMPVMDGVEYLSRVSGSQHPAVVMISSVSREDAVQVLKCLELGAADYIEKPKGTQITAEASRIREVLRAAVESRARRKQVKVGPNSPLSANAPMALAPPIRYQPTADSTDLIVIGASTGGIDAIRTIMPRFPRESPPIVIVQHIPPMFSELFANRLNEVSQVRVLETRNDMEILPGHAYIAQGGKHLGLELIGGRFHARESNAPHIHGCRPAVDYLFNSVAGAMGRARLRVAAALLTGMGRDGAEGMLALRERGATTIAQDEDTCIVHGMPKAAIELGAADRVLPLSSIPHHLFDAFNPESMAGKRKRRAA